jgi:hypothetical protein
MVPAVIEEREVESVVQEREWNKERREEKKGKYRK